LNGDKKIIYPICYFLLKNLAALRKRAYLAKYMVPIGVPQEYAGDPEIKQLN
jgi:intraflagellar transport protein 81